MPIAYRCDADLGITISVWEGAVTVEEWRDLVRRQLADPDWPCGRLSLADATTAGNTAAISDEEICEVAAMYRTQQTRIAGIKAARVSPHETRGALTFQRAMGPSGPTTLVFDDLEAACAWLGVSVDDVRPTLEELREELRGS